MKKAINHIKVWEMSPALVLLDTVLHIEPQETPAARQDDKRTMAPREFIFEILPKPHIS